MSVGARVCAHAHILTTTRLVPDVNQCEAAGQFLGLQRWSGPRLHKQNYGALKSVLVHVSGRELRARTKSAHVHGAAH